MIQTRIFKARVTMDIVVQAADADEAQRAVDRHTVIDGIPRCVGEITEVTELAQLPDGWDGGELAFSAWAVDTVTERPISRWLQSNASLKATENN